MKAATIVLFAGMVACAFVQPVSAAEATTFKEMVLYSFGGVPDGEQPYDSVIDVNRTLYGTTYAGGNSDCDAYCGTVFALDLDTGAEKVLYSFDGNDGANPAAGLIDVKDTLYGTTSGDGIGAGTVFSFEPKTDTLKNLYTFCSQPKCADGTNPGGLIYVDSALYGATAGGGDGTGCDNYYGCGTLFSVDPHAGAEKVLYSFCTKPRTQLKCTDGVSPVASLIDVNGTLYGTTREGGANTGCGDDKGCGTVFSFDPNTGAETVLYSFCSQQNCADGATPFTSLIDVNGVLYGTTDYGGVPGCGSYGCGTVFSIDPSTGAEKMVYSFCSQHNCTDGAQPFASLTNVSGTLYGTTIAGGGTGTGCGGSGCGAVFAVNPNTGAEKVLYSFLGGTDGAYPGAGLIDVNGKFYGTTLGGGAADYGTVFVLKKKR